MTPSTRGGSPLRNLRTFSSLKNRSYRFYFISIIGQWASTSMQQMTNSLLIYRLTGSAALLGTMAIANSLPILLFSVFGGVVADRVPKKHVLFIGLVGQAAVALAVALALTSGYLSPQHAGSWWVLIVTSFLQGSLMAFILPSQRAVIPEIVTREQVTNAVALNTMGMNVLQLLAPASTGYVIAAFGFQVVFFIMTILYLIGAIFVAFIPLTVGAVALAGNPLANIKEGFEYIRRESIILFIVIWSFCGMASVMNFTRLMPIFADDLLKVGAEGMGLWLSVAGAGALISSLTVASMTLRRRGLTQVASGIFHALATVSFAFNRSWYPSLGLMFFFGLGNTTGMMMTQALLQDYSAAEYRGRVFGIQTIGQGLTGIISFFIALLVTAIGAPWAIGGFSMFIIFLGIMTLVFNSRYRRLA
jgi:MFS family permease